MVDGACADARGAPNGGSALFAIAATEEVDDSRSPKWSRCGPSCRRTPRWP